MYQQTVGEERSNLNATEYLYGKLAGEIKNAGGLVVRENAGERVYFSLAVEEDKAAPIREKFIELLTDIIVYSYKYRYYCQKLKMPKKCLLDFKTLVKTLVAFDETGDREIAAGILRSYLPEQLSLDGYFNFRLKELKERWDTVIKLTSDNAPSLCQKDIFLEFIAFMLTSVESKHKVVNIYKENNGFILKDGQDKPIVLNELYGAGTAAEDGLITSLIYFAPEQIRLKFNDGLSKRTMEILDVLFIMSE